MEKSKYLRLRADTRISELENRFFNKFDLFTDDEKAKIQYLIELAINEMKRFHNRRNKEKQKGEKRV